MTALTAAMVGAQQERLVEQTIWNLDNLKSIGGHAVTVVGAPKVIETARGKALEFDGENDAIFFDVHPLAGAEVFTVEVIFQPYPNGLKEQRFFHMQDDAEDQRVLFETRLTDDDRWFLDTFIRTSGANHTQFAEDFKHPIGTWFHAAIVVDGETFRHYVNGKLELSRPIDYAPQMSGRTSLGVRINKVYWYKGAIRTARFTPRVLPPAEFLKP
jgi:hypothetical protein